LLDKQGRLRLIASPDGAHDSVKITADAKLYAGLFEAGQSASLKIEPTRKAYVHLVKGQLQVNQQLLHAGDALLLADEESIEIDQANDAEVLVFDLAAN